MATGGGDIKRRLRRKISQLISDIAFESDSLKTPAWYSSCNLLNTVKLILTKRIDIPEYLYITRLWKKMIPLLQKKPKNEEISDCESHHKCKLLVKSICTNPAGRLFYGLKYSKFYKRKNSVLSIVSGFLSARMKHCAVGNKESQKQDKLIIFTYSNLPVFKEKHGDWTLAMLPNSSTLPKVTPKSALNASAYLI
ncbi:hypothetical protein EGR_09945 [Echinococcus granulosus]|uniref:Uncharacterized protein n=1 Tax=Echinococcus granulosus TaxID=6210 RepID=W6UP52_ECHGR|nr:hypothetical protein EGR_09945 [Echinococcus granulosus]EUB55204.1 hypothetical protein EGR_09945 [Echinococcus granulosus]